MHRAITAFKPDLRLQWTQPVAVLLAALAATLLLTPAALALTCGANQITATIQVPKPNTPDVTINKQVCQSCKQGTAPNAAKTQCVPSAAGCPSKHLNPLANVCEPKCGPGKGINDFTNTCQSCTYNTVSQSSASADQHCVECASDKVPNSSHTACKSCPAGMVPAGAAQVQQLGTCVPANKKKSVRRPPVNPGLLEGTPGLGTQGPAATGNPLGRGTPGGGATRPGTR